MARSLRNRNRTTALVAVAVAAGMVGMSYAAVPLYRIFCQVTGYGGTTQVAAATPGRTLERRVTVRFNADVNRGMPWRFKPAQDSIDLKVGEQGLAFYRAHNPSGRTVTGTASFNVTPLKAGQYFNKIECFCFTEQTLAAGQTVDMPVTFFVDPAIADDPHLNDVTTITLSYTFFETRSGETAQAAPAPGAKTAKIRTDG